MKKKEALNEKLMYEISTENKRLSEPLNRALKVTCLMKKQAFRFCFTLAVHFKTMTTGQPLFGAAMCNLILAAGLWTPAVLGCGADLEGLGCAGCNALLLNAIDLFWDGAGS